MGEKDAATTSLLPTLREASRFRYTCVLYAPAAKREALAALHVFLSEIERVRDLVSEPLPGEIRLQWWRDVIAGIRSDEARQSPAADALMGVVDRYGLSKDRFDAYLEAMTFDLYDDPMPTTADLEGFFGETQLITIAQDLRCHLKEDRLRLAEKPLQ
ncbi:MAG: squalene/phytoene synthase family protein, partial [Pseudomonadota bacterium]